MEMIKTMEMVVVKDIKHKCREMNCIYKGADGCCNYFIWTGEKRESPADNCNKKRVDSKRRQLREKEGYEKMFDDYMLPYDGDFVKGVWEW